MAEIAIDEGSGAVAVESPALVFGGGTVGGATAFSALVTFNTPPTSPVAALVDAQAWGPGATVTAGADGGDGQRGLAIGINANAVDESVAVGIDAGAGGQNTNVAVGDSSNVAKGLAPHTAGNQSVAVGAWNRTKGGGNVSVGAFGNNQMTNGVAVGSASTINGSSTVAVGTANVGVGGNADNVVSVGVSNAIADGHDDVIAIGRSITSSAAGQGWWGSPAAPADFRCQLAIGEFGSAPPASQPAAIADPAGGATVDTEARAAIDAILAVLRARGTIDT